MGGRFNSRHLAAGGMPPDAPKLKLCQKSTFVGLLCHYIMRIVFVIVATDAAWRRHAGGWGVLSSQTYSGLGGWDMCIFIDKIWSCLLENG